MEKKQKLHYAWKVMAACILIMTGTAGTLSACMGNFVTPVVRELGCQVSQFTMVGSIQAICMALLYTVAAKLLNTKYIGRIMCVALVAEMTAVALMSTYDSVYLFYLSAVINGSAQAFTGLVAIPLVINMWFKKKTGTVLGIVIAIGNAAAMLYSLLSAQLITIFGWRMAYLILAAMGSLITIPAVFLLVKTPEEVGCAPYGAEEVPQVQQKVAAPVEGEYGLTKKQAFRMPLLYIAWFACILYSYGSGVQGYITTFTTMELAQTIRFGSVVGVCASLGGVLSSLIVGWINDRFGVKAGMLWGGVMYTIGYLAMFLGFTNPAFTLPAAFIVGLGGCMYRVQCPLLARSVVGSKHYSEIWAIMMVANSLIGGGLYSSFGLFYDKLGTYRGAFLVAIGTFIAAGLFGAVAINQSKKLRNQAAAN